MTPFTHNIITNSVYSISGSNRIAGPAYQIQPTRILLYHDYHIDNLTYSKFEKKSKTCIFPLLLIIILTFCYYLKFCLPERIFNENQLLDGSIGLSPLYSFFVGDLHVNIIKIFYQSFLRLQSFQVYFTIFRVSINTCCIHLYYPRLRPIF